MLNYEQVFWAAQAAFCAFALHGMMEPGQLLCRYGDYVRRMEYRRPWLAKPLGACYACFAGQVCLWAGFVSLGASWSVVPFALVGMAVAKILKR
jgi:hypothetical protein